MTPRRLDPATVRAKLAGIEELLVALRLIGPVDGARLRGDVVARLALERVLTQAVDQVVAVCGHVAAAQAAAVPTTYREAVRAAADNGLITVDLAESLASAVGLGNLLVHDYARVDLDVVAAAALIAERDLAAFVRQTAGWLSRRH